MNVLGAKKSKLAAFSLIELMIVIAIIGILAAIAIPAYGDYIIRSKASEMITSVSGLKVAMTEYRVVKGSFPSSVAVAGVTNPQDTSDMIKTVEIKVKSGTTDEAAIKVTGDGTGLGLASDETLFIYVEGIWASNGVKWKCTSSGETKYLPASCRDLPSTYASS